MLFTPFAPVADPTPRSPRRRQADRFALLLFALTAAAGLLVKYLV
jgi:hypothetical protein